MTRNQPPRIPKLLGALSAAALVLLGPALAASATELPVSGVSYLQTTGPGAGLTVGDWYTQPSPGGATDHLFEIVVPAAWPAGTAITVSLYDPEIEEPDPVSPNPLADDEIRGTINDTTFQLVGPNGNPVVTTTYVAGGGTNGTWTEFATFVPSGPGVYQLHSSTTGDDDNAWRLQVANDPDCTPGPCGGATLHDGDETSNPDGVGGTGDELYVIAVRASYQHSGSGQVCSVYRFFVDGGPSIAIHNFDMDNSGSVTYTRPDGSTVAGTRSSDSAWNNGTSSTRVGDVLAVGATEVGWWMAQICLGATNQFIFEVDGDVPVYPDQTPAVPRVTLSKSDGVATVDAGDQVTYDLVVANDSDGTPTPGGAIDVEISDPLPGQTSFVGCTLVPASAGSCADNSGIVTWTLSDVLMPGESVSLTLTVDVAAGATGTITNTAQADFDDYLGDSYAPVTATDVDTVDPVPVAVDDSYSTPEDQSLAVGAGSGLLANDQGGDNPTVVSAFDAASASGGSVSVAADGSFTYNPPADFNGSDTFTYTIEDANGDASTATVTITIGAVNDGPTAVDDSGSTAENSSVTVNLVSNDSDPDGDPLTISSVGSPASGTVVDNGDGTVTYTPAPNFNGTDSFTYTVCDGGTPNLCDTASVTIQVEPRGDLSGVVWEDLDGDGIHDLSEPTRSGVIVRLIGAGPDLDLGTVDDVVVATVVTDGTGYRFTDLADGDYRVVVDQTTLPGGWFLTHDPDGGADSAAEVTMAGTDIGGIDFGYRANHAPDLAPGSDTSFEILVGEGVEDLNIADPEGDGITVAVVGGHLPDGLVLNPDGTFAGVATVAGMFSASISMCDDRIPPACTTRTFSFLVSGPVGSVAGLPFTGADLAGLAMVGFGLIGVGRILTVTGRRGASG
jgi:uncharacterized repeat protein (TIGR01451 family)